MVKMVICCASSITTNVLVSKVIKACDEQKFNAQVLALPETMITKDIDADIILLAPQIRYTKEEVEKIVKNKIPVVVINNIDFATINGNAVVDSVRKILNK
ncbi:MAG: PTS sugar transporter subunit IIB [Beduini sp.]|uniref:PTS sugar transporter subunit IIB n=1 Tax=Beduini sp. TaxID=1922300 RepID=UPI00399F0D4A